MRKLALIVFVLLVPLIPSSAASAHSNCPAGWSHHHATNFNETDRTPPEHIDWTPVCEVMGA